MPAIPTPAIPLRRRCLFPAFLLACFLAAAPAWSYIVVLKDGKQITTDGKYERRGDEVILTLPNGTKASYPAADIDFAKTDEVNAGVNLSNARILETGDPDRDEPKEEPTATLPTLSDLVGGRRGSLAMPERQDESGSGGSTGPKLPQTGAGFIDFEAMRRLPYARDEIAAGLMRYLKTQGYEDVRVFQGTTPERPLVEIVAASEASVFKALRDSANALLQVVQGGASLDALELLLVTEGQVRAGQFTLTRPLANQIATGEVAAPTFFLRYVEF